MPKKKKAMKKAAAKKASRRRSKNSMGFAVHKSERAEILSNAERYADGNVSAWLRHAAINYDKPLRD